MRSLIRILQNATANTPEEFDQTAISSKPRRYDARVQTCCFDVLVPMFVDQIVEALSEEHIV